MTRPSSAWSKLLALACLTVACGQANLKRPVGYDVQPPPLPSAPPPIVHRPKVPDDAVARASGSVRLQRLADGVELSGVALTHDLLEYDAICAGEEHDSAAQHYGELWLLERLIDRTPSLGLELGVGLEMFATRFQPSLSAFAVGRLNEQRLLEKTEYEERWGYPFAFYRPLLDRARELGLPLLALNAPRELTELIAREGLENLDQKTLRKLPELELEDPAHRADFRQRMKNHPDLDRLEFENFYVAQVVWDETMAETAARWILAHAPVRRLLIVAGQAHCQRSAIPERTRRRGTGKVAALLLTTERPRAQLREQYDYALIVSPANDSGR